MPGHSRPLEKAGPGFCIRVCAHACVWNKFKQTKINVSERAAVSYSLTDSMTGHQAKGLGAAQLVPKGHSASERTKQELGTRLYFVLAHEAYQTHVVIHFSFAARSLQEKFTFFFLPSSLRLQGSRTFFFTGNYKSTALMKNTRLSFILCQGDTKATWLLWHCPLGHANTQQKACFPLEWIVYKISHCLENPTLCGYCPITVMAIPFVGLAHHSYGDLLVTVFEIPTMKTSFINFPSLLAYKWPNKVIHGSSVSIS